MKHTFFSRPAQALARRRFGVLAVAGLLVAGTALSASASVITTPDAADLAGAMASAGFPVTGSEFETLPPHGTPTAVGNSPLAGFPTDGPTYAILSTGDAGDADDPGSYTLGDNGGGHVRGDTDYDVVILRVDFTVPSELNCLQFDFKYLSDEWPTWVKSPFNDAFIAELDHSTWTTSGTTISAPDNFAFDPDGQPITVNAAGATAMQAQFADGTRYGGATPVLTAGTLLTPGSHSLFLSIFDQGDHIADSTVFLDNLKLSFAPTAADCPRGAAVKPATHIGLTPDRAVNQVGTMHTVDADLTDIGTHVPVSGGHVLFRVTGANPQTGEGITDAAGHASFSYAGHNPGQDAITACYDINDNGTCDAPDEPEASVFAAWQATAPPLLALTPPAATNVIGTTHTVTAHLTAGGGTAISGGHVLFTVAGANNLTGSAATNAAGDATFRYSSTSVGADQITACYDANDNGRCDLDEVTATSSKTWIAAAPALTLGPASATNPTGLNHTVSARLTSGTTPVENAAILFRVTGANVTSGEALTGRDGVATFSYLGVHPGHDTIAACYDAARNGTCGAGAAPPGRWHRRRARPGWRRPSG